jgi:hypothetical protein
MSSLKRGRFADGTNLAGDGSHSTHVASLVASLKSACGPDRLQSRSRYFLIFRCCTRLARRTKPCACFDPWRLRCMTDSPTRQPDIRPTARHSADRPPGRITAATARGHACVSCRSPADAGRSLLRGLRRQRRAEPPMAMPATDRPASPQRWQCFRLPGPNSGGHRHRGMHRRAACRDNPLPLHDRYLHRQRIPHIQRR